MVTFKMKSLYTLVKIFVLMRIIFTDISYDNVPSPSINSYIALLLADCLIIRYVTP